MATAWEYVDSMVIYKGVNALSSIRANQLLSKLQLTNPSITGICAEYIHFVNISKNLSGAEDEILKKLLTYGEMFKGQRSTNIVLATPRIGTISPWSSKATDIAHNSGLTHVERIERGTAFYIQIGDSSSDMHLLTPLLHDKMTETVFFDIKKASALFGHEKPETYTEISVLTDGISALQTANSELGLALSAHEIEYLNNSYKELSRNPSDTELMMFSVVNSEHCRHKIFNADWVVDGKVQTKSLFKKIKNTYEKNNTDILSAYSDNAAILRGATADRFYANPKTGVYETHTEPIHIVTKVETHNHPTAVAPVPGAATGAGGEIRDEGATGRGAKPKMGLAGFTVSNLNIPGHEQPWEQPYGKPSRIVSALDIMVDAPIGAAAFNNEFGRPNLAGYFRTYEQADDKQTWGYHKPIMIAGGVGNIKEEHVEKHTLPVGAQLIILGGPSMLIGLGGGTASSMQTGESEESLDYASVQRANAEMERRAQEVINACWALGEHNPIITIHDVGAGGISNALPELVHDSGLGAKLQLRKVPNAEPSMSPTEIWCNEAQERYVLGVHAKDLERFEELCTRERCPFAVVGATTKEEQLVVHDEKFSNNPVNIPMSLLFGKAPKMTKEFKQTKEEALPELKTSGINIDEAAKRVLQMPVVGSKKFLITIGDRSVGGLTVRDQMVGPWQVPVSDVAVTASSFNSSTGEAMAMGERTPLALINSPASARIAIGETITNIAAAPIEKISDIKLSANWMAAAGHDNEDRQLYEAVTAVGDSFCPELGITIPVGKDSLSMRTTWHDNQVERSVTSPLSLVITGFAPVTDTSRVLTPQLQRNVDSTLILIDLGYGKNRLGGSILSQAYNQIAGQAPDIESAQLKAFFTVIQDLNKKNLLLAYHDRSDGGLFATLCEMSFAARTGLSIELGSISGEPLNILFSEELGAIIQVKTPDAKKIVADLTKQLGSCIHILGSVTKEQTVKIQYKNSVLYENTRSRLEAWWSETSYQLQSLRDNPLSARQEFKAISDNKDPGLSPRLTYKTINKKYTMRPKVAVFREQGVNGQIEMAAAFYRAGFEAIDVHLNDIARDRVSLDDFSVLAVCGGFSYGDVLGAGEGWAKSILYNKDLRLKFKTFFERSDTLSLGICNGCQMLSRLKEIIPYSSHWPEFKKNTSEQFEARLVGVRVNDSPSIFFKGMEGSVIPIHTAHGEGRAVFDTPQGASEVIKEGLVPLQYVDNYGTVTETYPLNPNGSPDGITALTSTDGRATIIMPHPERGFLTQQYSWHPAEWDENGPWLKLFFNARQWVEENSN